MEVRHVELRVHRVNSLPPVHCSVFQRSRQDGILPNVKHNRLYMQVLKGGRVQYTYTLWDATSQVVDHDSAGNSKLGVEIKILVVK